MAHYGTLKDIAVTSPSEDIRGTHIYGLNDDKLGKIEDVIFDHSTGDIRYAIVDTGGWLHSKKFLVPADGLRASTRHEGDFETNLSKQKIESFPPYNESDLESESKWRDYEGKYRAKWVASPVMHRAETDRNLLRQHIRPRGTWNPSVRRLTHMESTHLSGEAQLRQVPRELTGKRLKLPPNAQYRPVAIRS